ncbi:MAG TPA: D-alanyl-D-alanine carboxypeptidase family protein [Gammaproteobacteria bacterium]|nr:D-alanyl-D-alanine carboxypeptidase family protein [Gammaproteobacteria bacterium]
MQKQPLLPLVRLLLPVFALLASLAAQAAPVPSPPEVDGESAFLMDFHSGQVMASQKADKAWPPASLAKMMTLYTAFEALADGSVAMDDTVRVSEKAWRTEGSRMFLEVGDEVPLKRIIKGIIVESGNDACVALAEHVAGTEKAFVQMMNSHAQELGLNNTHFANATGLPAEGMQTTARDMAHLAAALIRDFPQHYSMFSLRKMTYNDITQYNRNKLIWWDESVDGLKTGHTQRAGYALVSSAEREGMRLLAVVMGTDSERARAEESQSLLNYGFRFFRTYKLYEAGESLHEVRVFKGNRDKVKVALPRDLYVTIPRGQRDELEVTLDFKEPLIAPVSASAQVGTLTAKLNGDELAVRPLTTTKPVPEGGLFRRIIDSIRVWLTE